MQNRPSHTDFRLQKMEDIFDKSEGVIDTAHRHDYFTVLLVEQATGFHVIDYNKYTFGEIEVHFVSPGQVHQVGILERPQGNVLTFSKDFLLKNNIPISFISNINLFQSFGNTPPLQLDRQTFSKLRGIVNEMENCRATDLNYGQRAVGALLQLFLIYCNNSSKLDTLQIDEENAGICILRDFKSLVENKFKEWHKVKEYASEIHISPKHLSQTVKDITGMVAKDHIQERIILEAKRLLLHTELSIKEIAYEVGFAEPLHFSGFFKKKVKVSPSQFRKQKMNF